MKYLLLFISFFFAHWGNSQSDTIVIDSVQLQLKKEISLKHDYFSLDNLGNIYVVNVDQVFKYNSNGELLFKQSFKNMGDITSIDASQSLRTLIYYRDLTQVVFADNTLSIQGESIKLERDQYEFTTLTCASFVNNQFWIYRTDEFIVERLDKQLNKIVSSPNIVQLLRKEINPNFLIEASDYLFLNDPEQGILIFDVFGAYVQTIPIKSLDRFQVIGNTILYLEGNDLMIYDYKNFSLATLKTELTSIKQAEKSGNELIVSDGEKISIYMFLPK